MPKSARVSYLLVISCLFVVVIGTSCSTTENGIVTYDGERCIYEGPTDLQPGPYSLQFKNESDGLAAVGVAVLTRGYTIQDMIDFMDENPNADRPYWSKGLGTYKFIDAGEDYSWELELETGEHTIACTEIIGHIVTFGTGLIVEDASE